MTTLSYTELEYDYALSQGKPFFAVVMTESALDAKVKTDGKEALESDFPKELKYFREKTLGKISSFFSDSKDIKLAVHETLADFQQRYDFKGWIPGDEALDPSPFLEEIKSLQKERDDLRKELSARNSDFNLLDKASPEKWSDDDLHSALVLLKNIKVSTKVFNKEGEKDSVEYSVDKIFDAYRDSLIAGVTNGGGRAAWEIFLYYNICPKLELYELAKVEEVEGVRWQRYRLTPKGKAALIYMDKHKKNI